VGFVIWTNSDAGENDCPSFLSASNEGKKTTGIPTWFYMVIKERHLLGCPRKLGKKVSKWVITPIYPIYKQVKYAIY